VIDLQIKGKTLMKLRSLNGDEDNANRWVKNLKRASRPEDEDRLPSFAEEPMEDNDTAATAVTENPVEVTGGLGASLLLKSVSNVIAEKQKVPKVASVNDEASSAPLPRKASSKAERRTSSAAVLLGSAKSSATQNGRKPSRAMLLKQSKQRASIQKNMMGKGADLVGHSAEAFDENGGKDDDNDSADDRDATGEKHDDDGGKEEEPEEMSGNEPSKEGEGDKGGTENNQPPKRKEPRVSLLKSADGVDIARARARSKSRATEKPISEEQQAFEMQRVAMATAVVAVALFIYFVV
jgi:hypothetical protein